MQAIPLSIVYGTEATVPIETMVPSVNLVLGSKIAESRDLISDVEVLDEKRNGAK